MFIVGTLYVWHTRQSLIMKVSSSR
jgi:hypothetical protein